MKACAEIGVTFGKALVDGDFGKAHALLSPALQREMTSEDLRSQLFDMWSGYASGTPQDVSFNDESVLEEWPDKLPGDRAWIYVGISGDDFNEAVELLVSEIDGTLVIREIQWGRP